MKYVYICALFISLTLLCSIPSRAYYVREEESHPVIIEATISHYSSSTDETDSTPTITASNKTVYKGLVANNCLAFGQRVVINHKLYVVDDRMNKRYDCDHFDIWVESKEEGIQKGVYNADVEIVQQVY